MTLAAMTDPLVRDLYLAAHPEDAPIIAPQRETVWRDGSALEYAARVDDEIAQWEATRRHARAAYTEWHSARDERVSEILDADPTVGIPAARERVEMGLPPCPSPVPQPDLPMPHSSLMVARRHRGEDEYRFSQRSAQHRHERRMLLESVLYDDATPAELDTFRDLVMTHDPDAVWDRCMVPTCERPCPRYSTVALKYPGVQGTPGLGYCSPECVTTFRELRSRAEHSLREWLTSGSVIAAVEAKLAAEYRERLNAICDSASEDAHRLWQANRAFHRVHEWLQEPQPIAVRGPVIAQVPADDVAHLTADGWTIWKPSAPSTTTET